MRKRLLVLMVAATMLAVSAAPALAQGHQGKPQGQVEQGPDHANSICSFSGLNDHDPNEPPGGQTQSYGQVVSTLVKFGVHINAGPGPAAPGIECNGHIYPYPPGPPPPE